MTTRATKTNPKPNEFLVAELTPAGTWTWTPPNTVKSTDTQFTKIKTFVVYRGGCVGDLLKPENIKKLPMQKNVPLPEDERIFNPPFVGENYVLKLLGLVDPNDPNHTLRRANAIVLSLNARKQVNGVLLLELKPHLPDAEILAVCSDKKRGGSGKALIQRAINLARKRGKETMWLHALRHVISYYKDQFGFERARVDGTPPENTNGNDEDGWLMKKNIHNDAAVSKSRRSNTLAKPQAGLKQQLAEKNAARELLVKLQERKLLQSHMDKTKQHYRELMMKQLAERNREMTRLKKALEVKTRAKQELQSRHEQNTAHRELMMQQLAEKNREMTRLRPYEQFYLQKKKEHQDFLAAQKAHHFHAPSQHVTQKNKSWGGFVQPPHSQVLVQPPRPKRLQQQQVLVLPGSTGQTKDVTTKNIEEGLRFYEYENNAPHLQGDDWKRFYEKYVQNRSGRRDAAYQLHLAHVILPPQYAIHRIKKRSWLDSNKVSFYKRFYEDEEVRYPKLYERIKEERNKERHQKKRKR